MSKKQHQINEEIVQLMEQKKQQNATYTADEIKFIRTYTGSGGLAKQGASGRGLLYEYYTPYPVIEKMWGLAFKYGFTSGNILEPSCGTGRFLEYINPKTNTVDAYEFAKDNTISYEIAKLSFPRFNIVNDYFESIFYSGNKRIGKAPKYDLVIGNPPYGKMTGFYAGKSREGKHTKAKQYEHYFIEKGIELLKKNGLLVFIVPSSFMDNTSAYKEVKSKINDMAMLMDAYRLPHRIFETTDIQTDIVVFKCS